MSHALSSLPQPAAYTLFCSQRDHLTSRMGAPRSTSARMGPAPKRPLPSRVSSHTRHLLSQAPAVRNCEVGLKSMAEKLGSVLAARLAAGSSKRASGWS